MKKRKNEENDDVIPFCRFFDDIFRSSFAFFLRRRIFGIFGNR